MFMLRIAYLLILVSASRSFSFYDDEECISSGLNDESLSISSLMRRGFWNCAKAFIAKKRDSVTQESKNEFDLEQRMILKEISALKSAIDSALPMSIVSPAFKWAQSTQDILLSVKFSHKLDAPATLNVEPQTVNITSSKLVLHASDGRKKFVLEMDLLKDIVPAESTWSMASVGTMTLTLRKADSPSRWQRLTLSKKKMPNSHFWFEMNEKHKKELENFEDEDDEEGREEKKNKERAAARKLEREKEKEKSKAEEKDDGDDEDDKKTQPPPPKLSPEEQAIETELKTKLDALEAEKKEQAKIVDAQCRENRKKLESNFNARKKELEKIAEEQKAALTQNPNPSQVKVEEEMKEAGTIIPDL